MDDESAAEQFRDSSTTTLNTTAAGVDDDPERLLYSTFPFVDPSVSSILLAPGMILLGVCRRRRSEAQPTPTTFGWVLHPDDSVRFHACATPTTTTGSTSGCSTGNDPNVEWGIKIVDTFLSNNTTVRMHKNKEDDYIEDNDDDGKAASLPDLIPLACQCDRLLFSEDFLWRLGGGPVESLPLWQVLAQLVSSPKNDYKRKEEANYTISLLLALN